MENLFAVSSPGLEPFTAFELNRLGFLNDQAPFLASIYESGGVEFSGDLEAIYKANLNLRTASRVLVRLGDFHAAAFSELQRYAKRLPWHKFISSGQRVTVRATCHKSRLYHSTAVEREVIKAINTALGNPVIPCKSDDDQGGDAFQLVVVRLMDDHCWISIDSSGHLLHRRGYRLATAKAPLRETIAAGLLFASGWDCSSPLLDPFCGSGTIAIEAALLAYQMPPGKSRRFAFMEWPTFQPDLWVATLNSPNPGEIGSQNEQAKVQIIASDRDAGAIKIATSNAERAGVAERIDFSHRSVSAIEPHGKGWLVTNPPYGVRVSENKDLRNLYAQLGNIMRIKCQGWNFTIICNDMALLRQLALPMQTDLSLVNGGINIRVARGKVTG